MSRFRVGFESDTVKSGVTERHPDLTPIIDTDTQFAFGRVVALCPEKDDAEMLVALLNAACEPEFSCPRPGSPDCHDDRCPMHYGDMGEDDSGCSMDGKPDCGNPDCHVHYDKD